MIINSLLDVDLYKLTMCQFVYKDFPELVVKFKFKNRTKYKLGSVVPIKQLKREFDHVKTLRFLPEELDYLRTLRIFTEDFLEFLSDFKMPGINYVNSYTGLEIETVGYWKETILWETIVLSIVNQLYYENKYSKKEIEESYITGKEVLQEKIKVLNHEDIQNLITDFGTRRRFSQNWQEYVLSQIKDQSWFAGTSNVYQAYKHNISCVGTNAHEIYMVAAGYYGKNESSLRMSHSKVMIKWYDMYGFDLSIGLTDTFGTNFFLKDFKDKAEKWKGLRHDSGDPFEFGEKVIQYYQSLKIDPKEKLIVFSDGLSMDKIIKLYKQFNGRIKIGFGWGTTLTNDLGFETLSIVMKAVEIFSNGNKHIQRTLVKLSDNTNKHTGEPKMIEWYKKVFGYRNTKSEKLVV